MREFLNIIKALSDENRLRIIMMLRHGELCVCQIIELLGLAPSTVSKHMYILRQARLVDNRKDGRWIYYRLAENESIPAVRKHIRWVCETLASDAKIQQDDRHLQEIMQMCKEDLCKEQNKK